MLNNSEQKDRQLNSSSQLKKSFIVALFVTLVLLLVTSAATFAWYIYNTNAHTTKVKMAAGTTTEIQIAKEYDGEYSSSVDLSSFFGTLNPVSTDKITGGFQKVFGYTDGSENQPMLLANLFGQAESSDYFSTQLFVRTNAEKMGVYISNIDFSHDRDADLMATAVRVGLVVHEPGEDTPVQDEYIFELSQDKNPKREYNTYNGYEGCVLDSTKTDGSVVELKPYTKENYIIYDSKSGMMTKNAESLKLFDLFGGIDSAQGTPVQIDVYIWLEGCDEDCTGYLGSLALKNLAISFVGFNE